MVWFSVVHNLILINYYVTGFMVIHPLVVISFNKILPRLKTNAVESVCVILVEYKLCTHTCLLYSFPLVLFGDTLLLRSSRRRGGVHPELPGVRELLGVHLPVDIPVAPSFREFRTCFTLPHTLYQTFCHLCYK